MTGFKSKQAVAQAKLHDDDIQFKSSVELFDAGYAVMTYSIANNIMQWRFKDKSFVTSSVTDTKYVDVNGSQIAVYPVSELDAISGA
jgi:hypothetical protein